MHLKNKIRGILLIAFLIFMSLGLYTLSHRSYLVNEPIYIMAGYYYLTEGQTFHTGHPILSPIIAAIPLLFLDVDVPDPATIDHPFEFSRKDWLYYGNNDADTLVFWSRVPFLFLSFFFACYLFRWVRELYGLVPATLALFIYIFQPDILWASTVALTDLTVAGFMFVSCYYLWKYLTDERKKYLFLWGVFFGLALVSKSTALFVIPIYGLMLLLYKKYSFKNIIQDFFIVSFIALFVFAFINIADFAPIYDSQNPFYAQSLEFRTDERLQNLVEEFTGNVYLQKILVFGLRDVSVPGASSLTAYAAQFRHSVNGHSQYFMGEYTNHGVWYYYFFEYLVKTPVSFLLMLVFSCLLFMHLKAKEWKNELSLLIPILVFLFIASFIMKLNLGLRHTLFVHFFLIVFVAKVFQFKKYVNKVLPVILLSLVGLYILCSLLFAPYYIAYFNAFLAPERAPLYVIDDSLDWGQDLITLKRYMDENDIDFVKLRYAGFERPDYRNISYEKLGCEPTFGILAVSVNSLYGGRFWYEGIQKIDLDCYAWLREKEPIARLGYTIYVYNVTAEELGVP